MKNILVLVFTAFIAILSCRPARKIQTVVAIKDTAKIIPITSPKIDSAAVTQAILNRVDSNHIDFRFFSSKVKVDYTDSKGKNIDANAFIRIQKDSVIWVSLTGLLGIEGFRVMVKPDSVVIMDKLEKTIDYKSVAYLQELINLPVDYFILQDLLIGNPVFFSDNIVSFRVAGPALLALSVGDYFKHLITVDTTTNLILHSKLDDVDELKNRTCDITLAGYSRVQDRNFSEARLITVAEKAKLDIKLEFKSVVFDEPQSFPFNIPKNYKQK